MRRSVTSLVAALATIAVLSAGMWSAAAETGGQAYDDWKGEVATTPNADCEWTHRTLTAANPQSPGWPYIFTQGTVDGPTNCGNKSFQARPGALSIRQDLIAWDPIFSVDYTCNTGPRIANDGFWTHPIATQWGYTIAGLPPCGNTWYREKSYNFYNTINGGPWDGAIVEGGYNYVWASA